MGSKYASAGSLFTHWTNQWFKQCAGVCHWPQSRPWRSLFGRRTIHRCVSFSSHSIHIPHSKLYTFCNWPTARILTRQFIVPFLLGLKFNLVTILPLLFAGIILLLKKALFLGKFALFITGLLGFGGLLTFGQFGGVNYGHHPHRPFGGHGAGGGGGGLGTFGGFGQHDSISGGYYKSVEQNAHLASTERDPLYADTFYDFEKKLLQNKSDKLFDKEPKVPSTPITTESSARTKSYRSFVWEAA